MPSNDEDWAGVDLDALSDKEKKKILGKFNYFTKYLLPDLLRRDKKLAEELLAKAMQDPEAANDLRYHVYRLRGNGKL